MPKVKVVNPVWNGSGLVKRKVADYYVAEGRAEWLLVDPCTEFCTGTQIRLVESHPKNMAAAARAGACEFATLNWPLSIL